MQTGKIPEDRAKKYRPLFEKYGAAYGVDPLVLETIAIIETLRSDKFYRQLSRDERVINKDSGAAGMMQITNITGKTYNIHSEERHDLDKNVKVAAEFVSELMRKYGGDKSMVFAAYNWGPKNLQTKGAMTDPYHEAQKIEKWNEELKAYETLFLKYKLDLSSNEMIDAEIQYLEEKLRGPYTQNYLDSVTQRIVELSFLKEL